MENAVCDNCYFPEFPAASVSWCPKWAQRRGLLQEHMVHLSPVETEETELDMVKFCKGLCEYEH